MKAKNLIISQGGFLQERDFYTIRQQISGKGKVWGVGEFDIVKFHPFNHDFPQRQYQQYYNAIHGSGICLFCGEIDFAVLEQHHICREKLPDFTITLCANCHRRIHYFNGKHRRF